VICFAKILHNNLTITERHVASSDHSLDLKKCQPVRFLLSA